MFKSARIALAPITRDDLAVMFGWINDRDDVLSNAPYKPISESDHQDWFESVRQRTDTVLFGIRLLETSKLIGSCQLHSISEIHRSSELQIRLGDASERGKGLGTEAVKLLLSFAFNDLNLHRVYLHVFNTNTAAIRSYEKAGFVREGVLRQAAHINGDYLDVFVMGILREEHAGK